MMIQEERSVFWEVIISVVVDLKLIMDTRLIMNGYRDRTVGYPRPNFMRFLFVELDEELSLQKETGYTKRIARSHFGCCCPHEETCR
jgi:hypothetical protein